MKKLIILLLVIASAISAIHAQCTLPYKSLCAFNNDTTSFVTYNFDTRSTCYVGKTMANVIADLGISVQSYLIIGDDFRTDLYSGIYLHLYPYYKVLQLEDSCIYKNEIAIEWDTPIDQALLDPQIKQTNRHKWTEAMYNLLKDKKIKDIGIVRKR